MVVKHAPIRWKRRSVLKALALAAPLPSRLVAAIPATPDVVIVGGGAAGLAAAKTLAALRASFVLVEAAGRTGGRCHTDTSIFGVPYDTGAHWMETESLNPLVGYAVRNGFDVYRAPDRGRVYVGARKATAAEQVDAEAAFEQATRAIAAAGIDGRGPGVRTGSAARGGGRGVVVATSKGELRAKVVIVTVSTGVLRSGHVRFRPELPAEKRESFDAISMGTYNNVALHFSEDVFGEPPDSYVNNRYRGEDAIGFLTNIGGSNLVFGYVGGRFGASLESAGVEASVDYALGEVKRMLGNGVAKKFRKGTCTRWGRNRLTKGAYAPASPGGYPLRAVLREPVAERIYFAGEACHPTMWATVGGAVLSGAETAAAAAKRITA